MSGSFVEVTDAETSHLMSGPIDNKTGAKTFNFGANPNTGMAGSTLGNPLFVIAAAAVLIAFFRYRRKGAK